MEYNNVLVDGYLDGAQEHPLSEIMEKHADEEDDDEHEQHAPELPAAPLGQPQLGQELALDVAQLLTALLGHVTLTGEWRPTNRKGHLSKHLYIVLVNSYLIR